MKFIQKLEASCYKRLGAFFAFVDDKGSAIEGYSKILKKRQGSRKAALEKLSELAVGANASPLSLNGDKIQAVRDLFDHENAHIYTREIAYLSLKSAAPVLAAICSPYSVTEFERQKERFRLMLLEGAVPPLCTEQESLFDGAVGSHMTTTFAVEQYTYEPYVKVEHGDIVLDCGGCHGDTAIWAVMQGAKAVYTFEPSSFYSQYIENNTANYGEGKIFLQKLGISDRCGKLGFVLQAGSSHITADLTSADEIIDVVDIDTWCATTGVAPSFLKFDIEGAEIEGLKGAAETIKKYKPKLAVSLYHTPEHMWEIPLLLKSYVDEYSFWCRKNHPQYEFVLYAAVK